MKRLITGALAIALWGTVALAGVSGIKDNGRISGVPSYQIQCSSGSSYIIYKKNGTWYKSGSHMGNKYNSWSVQDVGSYLCN